MWLDVLNITAPLFMLIGLGYFSVRINLFQQAELQGTAKFVMRIGLPALIFNSIAGQPLNQVFNPAYVAGYGSASLAVFAIGYLVSRHIRKKAAVQRRLTRWACRCPTPALSAIRCWR